MKRIASLLLAGSLTWVGLSHYLSAGTEWFRPVREIPDFALVLGALLALQVAPALERVGGWSQSLLKSTSESSAFWRTLAKVALPAGSALAIARGAQTSDFPLWLAAGVAGIATSAIAWRSDTARRQGESPSELDPLARAAARESIAALLTRSGRPASERASITVLVRDPSGKVDRISLV